jgi:hypothetical protein
MRRFVEYRRGGILLLPARAQWKALEFLLGPWQANGLGGSADAAGSGAYSFRLELGDSVLATDSNSRAEFTSYLKWSGKKK